MALPQMLIILSLLPLLEAQNPAHANITEIPITNATLDWLSGKWFFIGSAHHNPEYKQAVLKIQADFFHFAPNLTEDTILVREYQTIEDRCVYNSTLLQVQRENGTLSKFESGREHFAKLKLLRKYRAFMLAFALEDEKNRGLSFYADKPDVTPELLKVYQETAKSVGIDESEITYIDWKK
uniref:Lipocalin/cytosolic fatty-acid binding domain-containing protein n=2 Tax=Nannospalax galili TaxID=1026970 RepID=A0A8C6W7Q0_NANGA